MKSNKNNQWWKISIPNNMYLVVIVFLLLWGTGLRIVELVGGNFLFGHDHGRDYLAAYNIVENHKLTLIGSEVGSGVAGINGIFHGPGYIYLMTVAYILFAGNPVGGQILMVLAGLSTLILSWYTGLKVFGKIGSVLLLFFTSVSPLLVSQSRFIWSVHPITPLIVLAIYCVYKIPQKPKLFGPLALLASGLTYHFQLGVAVPMISSILIAMPLVYRVRDIRVYLYSLGTLVFVFLPMIFFEMRHGYMAANSAWNYIFNGGNQGTAIFEAKRLSEHVQFYWYNFLNSFTFEFGWITNIIQKKILFVVMPVIAYGVMFFRKTKHKVFIQFLFLMSVVTWVEYLFLNNTIWDYYLAHLRFVFFFIFTYAGTAIIRARNKNFYSRIAEGIFYIFIISVFVGSIHQMYISYTYDVKDLHVYEKIAGKKLVLDTIYNDAEGKPFSVFVFVPSVYTWPYDYLFLTYGKQTYGYEPNHEKKGLAYLIIEPDKSQPWRSKGWLETVVNGGTTIWEKTVLNGLVVQKKIYP